MQRAVEQSTLRISHTRPCPTAGQCGDIFTGILPNTIASGGEILATGDLRQAVTLL